MYVDGQYMQEYLHLHIIHTLINIIDKGNSEAYIAGIDTSLGRQISK